MGDVVADRPELNAAQTRNGLRIVVRRKRRDRSIVGGRGCYWSVALGTLMFILPRVEFVFDTSGETPLL